MKLIIKLGTLIRTLGISVSALLLVVGCTSSSMSSKPNRPGATDKEEGGLDQKDATLGTNSGDVKVDEDGNPIVDPKDVDSLPEEAPKVEAGRALKNFREINRSFSIVTGVPESTGTVDDTFNLVKSNFPTENKLEGFSHQVQAGMVKLAAEYCEAIFQGNSDKSAMIIGGFNVGQTPDAAFAGSAKGDLVMRFIDEFWLEDMSSGGQMVSGAKAMFETMIDEIVASGDGTAATTQRAAMGACVAVLSSAPSMFY